MSQTERKPDLPELPRGLNRMMMTSPWLLPYRPSLVRYLTLGVGTALAAAGLIIGGGLGVLPALGLMAASALALNTVATLCDLGQKSFFFGGNREQVATPPNPSCAFALKLGQRLIAAQTNKLGPIELRLGTDFTYYRATAFRNGHTVIEMNPENAVELHEKLATSDGVSAGTTRFAEIHAFALQHEIQHRQQPSWQYIYDWSLFLASSCSGLFWAFGNTVPSLTGIFTCLAAPTGIYALNLIRSRQNELDADSAAVRQLGSADAARTFFEVSKAEIWKRTHPPSALRIAAAELQESRLTEAERRGARAAFNALYKTTIAEFPELGGQRHPTGSPSSVQQNIPELA